MTINRGYSKGRPDLIQLVQCLVTTENGLPFWQQTHSGNTNDRSIFQSSIEAVQAYVKTHLSDTTLGFVADSALYSKKFLLNKAITGDWIARVPESIHEAKSILEKNTEKTDWTRINADFKFREIDQSYAGVKQRWMIIENRESKYKELDTFRRKLDKEEQSLKKRVAAFNQHVFDRQEEIELSVNQLRKRHPLFTFSFAIFRKRRKRQRKNQPPLYQCMLTCHDHLGLIAAIFKEYRLVERIDSLIPKRSHHQKISHGQAIAAMIYQGLGFSQKRLYSAKQFFTGMARRFYQCCA